MTLILSAIAAMRSALHSIAYTNPPLSQSIYVRTGRRRLTPSDQSICCAPQPQSAISDRCGTTNTNTLFAAIDGNPGIVVRIRRIGRRSTRDRTTLALSAVHCRTLGRSHRIANYRIVPLAPMGCDDVLLHIQRRSICNVYCICNRCNAVEYLET